MGLTARFLMTIGLLVCSISTLTLLTVITIKYKSICKDRKDEACQSKPILTGVSIVCLVLALWGVFFSLWKAFTKSQDFFDAVKQNLQ
jgi:predicted RND superfamily exporter protein